jgi:hypothetical protein
MVATASSAAGHGRCPCAFPDGPGGEARSARHQWTTAGANARKGRWCGERTRTMHRSIGLGKSIRRRRRQRCPHCPQPRTSTARQMSDHQSGSRRMSARFATELSGGRANNARRYVPKRRCRASAIRRGSVEHPRDNSPRPYAESDLESLDRCAVFQDVAASDRASIDVHLRDTSDRRLRVGSAQGRPAIEASTVAKTATTDGQRGGSAYENEPGYRVGGAGRASRARGLGASRQTIAQHLS